MGRLLGMLLATLLLSLGVRAQQVGDGVAARLAGMSLEQRVAQLFMVTLHGAILTEVGAAHLTTWQPGAVVLFTSNAGTPEAVARLTNSYQAAITGAGGVPLLIASDHEGGVVQRLHEGFTTLPAAMLIGAAGADAASDFAAAVAAELRGVGVTMNLAPVADLETFRENPIIRRRSFGGDPDQVSRSLSGYVRGLQSGGVVATAKHFPGHGETREDSHAVLTPVDLPRARLEGVEVAPFRAAIAADVGAIMVAHVWYPAYDPDPLPASLSPAIITGLLRDQLGYDGVVMTDALDMGAVALNYTIEEAAIRALEAGGDMLAMGPAVGLATSERVMRAVIEAVRAGRLSEARIDESVRRVLTLKARFGLLDGYTPVDPAAARAAMPATEAAVAALYDAGVTVERDAGGLVPLPGDRRVGVIFPGTRYQIYNECSAYRSDVTWRAISDAPSADEIAGAAALARGLDVVVVFTQNAERNAALAALVNALPPEKTVAVALWSPYDRLAYPGVSASLLTYAPLRPAVTTACAVLFGALPARGRSPLAWAFGGE